MVSCGKEACWPVHFVHLARRASLSNGQRRHLAESTGSAFWSVGVYAGLSLVLLLLAAGLSARLAPLLRSGPLMLLDRTAGLGIGLCEAALIAGLIARVCSGSEWRRWRPEASAYNSRPGQ